MNPKTKIIELNRGDAVRPLSLHVVKAMSKALVELSTDNNLQGRGAVEGYKFLIDAIVKSEYKAHKIKMDSSEIFINEGTKSELAAIGDIFCNDNRIATIDPVYQTYIESNAMAARAGAVDAEGYWSNIIYMNCPKEQNFSPQELSERPDVIYICSPNDPTGCALTHSELTAWVEYANSNNSLIIFDATYEAFITERDVPHSIYEIKGARKCAIELRSFSKSASFTTLHCGYTVIPKDIEGYSFSVERKASLNEMWHRRQEVKNYAPSYAVQRGAEALFTAEGKQSIKENIEYYMHNAALLRQALSQTRLKFWGGINSPFIWVESPYENSWELFDKLLNDCNILSSPGHRFGPAGRNFVRLSAFADQRQVTIAASRLSDLDI